VALPQPQSSPYSAGGDAALVDGIRGSIDYRGGDWQGYESKDFEAVVDLGTPQKVATVKCGFLQNAGARVFLPTRVDIEVSEDGRNFEPVASLGHDVPLDTAAALRKYFEATVRSARPARFVRVRAANIGRCPKGHEREGAPAWLYVDEIIVR
jgi:hypothetical protein